MTVVLAAQVHVAEERSVQRFGRDTREVRIARQFVADRLRLRGAPPDVVEAFRLAASELGANAIEHGDSSGWTAGVAASPLSWTMTVIGGHADRANPVLHPAEWSMVPPTTGHGRGLAIVAALMDSVTVDVVARRMRVCCCIRR